MHIYTLIKINMEKLPSEINGLIFSYLDAEEILKYMKTSEECCVEIKKCSKYIALDVLNFENMDDILYFTNMKVNILKFYESTITNEDLKVINERIKRIECINAIECLDISDDGLKYLKNIQRVMLYHCEAITDNGFVHLGNVDKLIIYCNDNITNSALKFMSNIYHIELSACDKINDKGLEYLKNVHTLSLTSQWRITNDGIKKLKNVKYLQLIDVNITNECFKYLGNVELLYIGINSLISDNGLKYLSNINFIKFVDCKKITMKGINKLLKRMPKLIWRLDDVGNYRSNRMNFFDEQYGY
jgi:hypothetical protein